MKGNNVYKNYFYNLSYQLLLILIPIITIPYISRVLGAEGIGAYSYAQSIAQYFIIFGCIGLNLYGQREIAYVQNNPEKRSRIFWELIILRSITITISLIIYLGIALNSSLYMMLFLIIAIDIFSTYFDISWFFQGLENFKKIVIRNIVIKLLGIILIFTLVNSIDDLYLYALIQSSTLFFSNIYLWIKIKKYISFVHRSSIKVIRHIRPTLILFLPQIATSFYTILDKPMIAILSNNISEVAYYEQSQKIVKLAMAIITSLGAVMMPKIANKYANNDKESIDKYMYRSFQFTFFMGIPMSLGLAVIANNFVPWFYGEGFNRVIPNIIIISPIVLLIGLGTVMGRQYFVPTNKLKVYTIAVIIGAVINVSLNLLLIPYFQSLGAALATVIAELCVMGYMLFSIKNEFSIKKIFSQSANYIMAGIVMLIVVLLIKQYLLIDVISTFIEIIVGCIVYLGYLIIVKDKFLINIMKYLQLIKR